MGGLTNLLLLAVPPLALLSGLILAGASMLHLGGRRTLPDVDLERKPHAVAALLLGAGIAGLGGTYLLTGGERGHDALYLGWLLVAGAAGVVAFASLGD